MVKKNNRGSTKKVWHIVIPDPNKHKLGLFERFQLKLGTILPRASFSYYKASSELGDFYAGRGNYQKATRYYGKASNTAEKLSRNRKEHVANLGESESVEY